MIFLKKVKNNEYYKYKNKKVRVYIPKYNKNVLFHTDKFNYVMDQFRISGYYNHRVIYKISTPDTFYRRFYRKNLSPRKIIFRLYYEILLSSPHNKYFITINKLGKLGNNKDKSRKLMTEFLKRLNQRAIGRYSHGYLQGMVIEEKGEDDSYHYHIVLSDPENILTDNYDTFYKQVELAIASLNRSCLKCNKYSSKSLVAIPNNCWDVQKYYKQYLEQYITKNFEIMQHFDAADTIGIIAPPNESYIQEVYYG